MKYKQNLPLAPPPHPSKVQLHIVVKCRNIGSFILFYKKSVFMAMNITHTLHTHTHTHTHQRKRTQHTMAWTMLPR